MSSVAEPAPSPVAQPPVRRGTLVALGALSAFGPLSLDLYLPGLPSLADDLGTSASAAQLTLTACLLGLATGQLLAGPLSDARGRRRPLLVGVALYVAASLACAAAPSIGTLIALRFVQGLAGSAGLAISRAVVRDLREGVAAARMFAALLLVNGVAPIAAPILGGQLLHVTDWRGLFVVLAGLGVLILLATAVYVPETHAVALRRPGGLRMTLRVFRTLLAERRFPGCTLAGGLVFAAMFGYIAGSPFVLQDIYGLSAAEFSAVFACNALGIVTAAQVSSRLLRRMTPTRVLATGLTTSALGGVALLVVVSTHVVGLPGVLPALFVVVSSVGIVVPSGTAIALEGHASTAGAASALLGLTQYSIGAVTAPLVGVAGKHTALPMALLITTCGCGSVLAYVLLVRRSPPVG